MARHEFGGKWTDVKLDRVRRYLQEYMKIFGKNQKAQYLTPIYVDAFAGTGYRAIASSKEPESAMFPDLVKPDAVEFVKGSAHIALEIEPSFHRFVFVERKPDYTQELEKLKNEFPGKANRIEIVQDEANAYLKRWCAQTDYWHLSRAVVFLDPYGMQVDWTLLEAIAKTKAIDLWILFPLGAAVMRLLTRTEPPADEWARALTRIFGTEDWKEAFYPRQRIMTLFGEEEIQGREADFTRIGQFFVERLQSIFTVVAPNPLPLRNSKNVPLYLLCFAAGNPQGGPTALKIAKYILER